MGADVSVLPAPCAELPFFTLTFRAPNRIGLVLADEFAIEAVRRAIMHHWRAGIYQEFVSVDGSYQITLRGNPFMVGPMEALDMDLQSKHICCKLLSDLRFGGWKLALTSDLSKTHALSTLFFQRCSVTNIAQHMVCLSLTGRDKLELIGAPVNLKWAFREAVMNGYGLGIEHESSFGYDYILKLRGDPWQSRNLSESMCGRKVILDVFRQFEMNGFKFYGKANLKDTADSIFFKSDDFNQYGNNYYMMISLNGNDYLRVIEGPANVIAVIRQCIAQYWMYGVEYERPLGIGYEFKMNGDPWLASGPETVSCRYVLAVIFQQLLSMGWCLVSSLDVDRKCSDKSVFILRSFQPMNMMHCCISLNDSNKIRLINASPDLPDLFREVILRSWPFGIRAENIVFNSYQFTLNGNPWWSNYLSKDYLAAGYMMCSLLKALSGRGWIVVCSADVSAKHDQFHNTLDIDSWFAAYSGTGSVY